MTRASEDRPRDANQLPWPPPAVPSTTTVGEEWIRKFHDDLKADIEFEDGLLMKEAWVVVAIILLLLVRQVFL